jgi:hypothetical protein
MALAAFGRWGNHHFILTAEHVIHPDAKPADLRLFWRPFGDDKYLADSDLQAEHITSGVSIKDPNARIIRCQWEDLAIIKIDSSEAGQYSEFVDMATDWVDPSVDEVAHVFGYCGFRKFWHANSGNSGTFWSSRQDLF